MKHLPPATSPFVGVGVLAAGVHSGCNVVVLMFHGIVSSDGVEESGRVQSGV